jgi:DNA-directed RNA polymerase specialized sigma24 family protein
VLCEDIINEVKRRKSTVLKESLLWKIEGYKYEEIAEINNIPVGTIKARLHRCKKQLNYL